MADTDWADEIALEILQPVDITADVANALRLQYTRGRLDVVRRLREMPTIWVVEEFDPHTSTEGVWLLRYADCSREKAEAAKNLRADMLGEHGGLRIRSVIDDAADQLEAEIRGKAPDNA